MTLPNLIVVGAPKCATTSLHFYLSHHPQVWMSKEKELHFFMSQASWGSWNRGLGWYSEHFRKGANCLIRGESSPGYSIEGHTEDAVENMFALLPDTRLIYMMRDPIARIRSHYLEEVYNGHIPPEVTLESILCSGPDEPGLSGQNYQLIVYTSLYFRQLSFYLKRYSLEKIHLLTMEQMTKNTAESLRGIFDFLGVENVVCEQWETKLNVNAQKRLRVLNPTKLVRRLPGYQAFSMATPALVKSVYRRLISRAIDQKRISDISAESEEKLRELFAPDVASLRALTGLSFFNWSL